MPNNEVDIKIKTSVEGDELSKLNNDLKQLKGEEPKIKVGADTSEASSSLDNVKKKTEDITPAADGASSSLGIMGKTGTGAAENIVKGLNGAENATGNFSKTVSGGSGAWSVLKNSANGAIDSILGGLESATSKMSSFLSGLSGADRVIGGVLGAVGVKSINDLTIANAKAADTNKTLMKTMTKTADEATSLWNASDKATNNSLMSMRELVPTMSAFQLQTGANAKQMELFAETASKLGSKSLALGYSSERTATSVMALGNGLEGAYAAIDHLGITEQTLKDTGLWTGKKEDVEGYLNAVQAVTGNIDDLMTTVEGKEKTVYKKLSTAGRQLGEEITPVLEQIYDGFLGINKQTDGFAAKLTVGAAGAVSTFAMIAPQLEASFSVFGRVSKTIGNLRKGADAVSSVAGAAGAGAKVAGVGAQTAELAANTSALAANTAALEANNLARASSMGGAAKGIKGIGAVGSAASGAAPGAAAGGGALSAISASITSMLIPLIAISAVIAIMIPIVAGLAIEVLLFVRLIGEVVKVLAFDKLNLGPAIDGIKQIGLAMFEIGKAMAAITFVNIVGIVHAITGGVLTFFVSLAGFVAEVKAGVPIINELAKISDIDPAVANKIKQFNEACQQVVTAVQALSTIDSSLFNWNPFTNFIESIKTAKEDITEAARIINNFKDIHNIDPAVANKLKAVTDSLKHVADSISALRTVDDKLQTWNPMSNLIEAMKSARTDIGNASIILMSYSTIANVPEGTAEKIKTVASSLKNVSDSITSLRKIDDEQQTWNPMTNLITAMRSARTDIGTASVILAGYSTLANIPEGVANKIQRVQWTITHVVNALNSLNTVNDTLGKVDLSGIIGKLQTARTNIGLASVSLASYNTLANIDSSIITKIDGVKNTIVRVAQAVTALNGVPVPAENNNVALSCNSDKKCTY